MTKEETLRAAALDACPHCGAEKTWYSQHWAKSADCRYPRIDEAQHALIQGLLLGDASLEGNPDGNAKLRLETTNRRFAGWVYDELGWLATVLEHHSEAGADADHYRVKAMAHPDCNRYRDWYHDGEKVPPLGFHFTPRIARAFHACDGNLSFGHEDTPHIEFRATNDRYRERLVAALERWRVPTTASTGRVRIPKDAVAGWLQDIGSAVPGVEHKWERHREHYERLREE